MKRIITWITELYWKHCDWSCCKCGETKRDHGIERCGFEWAMNTTPVPKDKRHCAKCGYLNYINWHEKRKHTGDRAFYCDTCDKVSWVKRGDNIPSHQTTCGSCRDQLRREKLTKELV